MKIKSKTISTRLFAATHRLHCTAIYGLDIIIIYDVFVKIDFEFNEFQTNYGQASVAISEKICEKSNNYLFSKKINIFKH